MMACFIIPDESVQNPTTDQLLSNSIAVKTRNEARLYREAYLEWHKKRSQINSSNQETQDRNDIHWNYISAKITRANLLSYIKKTVMDKEHREHLIDLFDLKTVPVRPVHFERHINAA